MMKLLLSLLIIVCLPLGVFWVIWCAWAWALPQIWPTGPQGIISPGYWLFVVCALLLSWIGRILFGRGDKSK